MPDSTLNVVEKNIDSPSPVRSIAPSTAACAAAGGLAEVGPPVVEVVLCVDATGVFVPDDIVGGVGAVEIEVARQLGLDNHQLNECRVIADRPRSPMRKRATLIR